MSAKREIRETLSRIEAAWRNKDFEGREECFHEHAVIVGSGYAEYANGRKQCAESYREFATNADVLDYSEEAHDMRVWQKEVTVRGLHFIQEDSPLEIGKAVSDWRRSIGRSRR